MCLLLSLYRIGLQGLRGLCGAVLCLLLSLYRIGLQGLRGLCIRPLFRCLSLFWFVTGFLLFLRLGCLSVLLPYV